MSITTRCKLMFVPSSSLLTFSFNWKELSNELLTSQFQRGECHKISERAVLYEDVSPPPFSVLVDFHHFTFQNLPETLQTSPVLTTRSTNCRKFVAIFCRQCTLFSRIIFLKPFNNTENLKKRSRELTLQTQVESFEERKGKRKSCCTVSLTPHSFWCKVTACTEHNSEATPEKTPLQWILKRFLHESLVTWTCLET